MAKGKTTTQSKQGAATKADRIAKLETSVGASGIKQAEKIVSDFQVDVIRLAALRLPTIYRQGGLGKRIENMLATLPKAEADKMRQTLLTAKAAVKD